MRKSIIILSICTVVLLLGYCSFRGYEVWKQNHWMTLAKEFAAKGDGRDEYLCLQQVLRTSPKNVEACRLMANVTEAAHSPEALAWRQRVLDLNPDSLDDRLALARSAVIFRDYAMATNTLAGIDAAGRATAGYYNVAGALAIAQNRLAEAEADFRQAVQLDPTNPLPKLNLAIVQLHGHNPQDMAQARLVLQQISQTSTNLIIRSQAERELISDALQRKDNETALALSQKLARQNYALFTDKLLRLEVLDKTGNGAYPTEFAAVKREAAGQPQDLSALVIWLMERHQPGEALAWLQSLPPNIQTNQPAALLAAQCQIQQANWTGLQKSISKQNWKDLEFTRHAYLACALRKQGLYEASKAEWDVAVHAANGQLNSLAALLRLSAQWNWPSETQQLLWSIVDNYPRETWAAQNLVNMLYANGSTRPLMQLFGIQANRNPSDLDAKNNLALTAMLLHAQELNPYQLAREVYEKAPTNPSYASTYAFSLHLQGKDTDALKVMRQLPPKALDDPANAGYYGIILKANGDASGAKNYLRLASQGQLLPEERAMFQQALSGS